MKFFIILIPFLTSLTHLFYSLVYYHHLSHCQYAPTYTKGKSLETLYAPWRTAYATDRDSKTKKEGAQAHECVFCAKIQEADDQNNFIIRRFKHSAVLLNLFPYNPGHLLIIPLTHTARLHDLSSEMRAEIIELVSHSSALLETVLHAQGINSGLNIGKAAGAGIPSHLHWHVLPRWSGDTNFMPLIAQTKVFSINLNQMYDDLKPHFEAIKL